MDHLGQIAGIPLAVGIEGRDVAGAPLPCRPVTGPKGHPVPAVARQPQHGRAIAPGHLGRIVLRPVVNDEHVEPVSGGAGGNLRKDSGEVGRLVQRGDHHDDGGEVLVASPRGEVAHRRADGGGRVLRFNESAGDFQAESPGMYYPKLIGGCRSDQSRTEARCKARVNVSQQSHRLLSPLSGGRPRP